MVNIANPIYDAVFKYLMENERDEEQYADDPDMQFIIHRLMAAASDAKLRQDMNVEDEYFTAIENRDTAIMQRDKKIKEQDKQLAEQSNQLQEQSNQLAEKDKKIIESARAMKTAGMDSTLISQVTGIAKDIIDAL